MKKRIAFIALSGVRAENKKLLEVGLTLPGVVERSQVIASLPSLGLLTLAALTPTDEYDVEYHEIKDLTEQDQLPTHFDLVAISTYSAQIYDAYAIADYYEKMGIPTVIGGLHVTVLPQEAAEHCTAVIQGEGEPIWPTILNDFREGQLKSIYANPNPDHSYDLNDAPLPRYDLLDMEKYNRLTVQTTRGCPHRCDFCASSILLTKGYERKPVPNIIAEIRHIKKYWPEPFIEFADDNSFADRGHAKELLTAMIPENIKWFTEADISIAKDPELLEIIHDSGCRQILIGLESPQPAGLDGLELRSNWKLKQINAYKEAITTIQSHGITVNGCFILGLDGHTPEIFDAVHDFVDESGLYEVQITVLTAFPGTPLYQRLCDEGRIIEENAWQKCTLFDVNHKPSHMTPEQLEEGLINLGQRLYDQEAIRIRRTRFFHMLKEKNRIIADQWDPEQP